MHILLILGKKKADSLILDDMLPILADQEGFQIDVGPFRLTPVLLLTTPPPGRLIFLPHPLLVSTMDSTFRSRTHEAALSRRQYGDSRQSRDSQLNSALVFSCNETAINKWYFNPTAVSCAIHAHHVSFIVSWGVESEDGHRWGSKKGVCGLHGRTALIKRSFEKKSNHGCRSKHWDGVLRNITSTANVSRSNLAPHGHCIRITHIPLLLCL